MAGSTEEWRESGILLVRRGHPLLVKDHALVSAVLIAKPKDTFHGAWCSRNLEALFSHGEGSLTFLPFIHGIKKKFWIIFLSTCFILFTNMSTVFIDKQFGIDGLNIVTIVYLGERSSKRLKCKVHFRKHISWLNAVNEENSDSYF